VSFQDVMKYSQLKLHIFVSNETISMMMISI